MKNMVCIRYEKKYKKWMKRLETEMSISEEELKKGGEADGADGYKDKVLDENPCIS